MDGMSASDAEELRKKKEKDDAELAATIAAVERMQQIHKMDEYSYIRSEREKATFTMMMKMNPVALTNIRKEFFAREDALTLDEFMFVINKHLINKHSEDDFVMETPEQRDFGANMFELFKDIDINGDGDLEWQEFTTFVVEKANLLNKRQKLASLAHYSDSTSILDASAAYRHRNDISKVINFPVRKIVFSLLVSSPTPSVGSGFFFSLFLAPTNNFPSISPPSTGIAPVRHARGQQAQHLLVQQPTGQARSHHSHGRSAYRHESAGEWRQGQEHGSSLFFRHDYGYIQFREWPFYSLPAYQHLGYPRCANGAGVSACKPPVILGRHQWRRLFLANG